jgi:hypothetical protein
LVSPDTRVNDVRHKLIQYHRVGVRQYIIADQRREDRPREVCGYRWTRSRYVQMRPDANARVRIKVLGISLGLIDERVWAFDLDTGERIPDAVETAQGLAEAEERIRRLEAERRQARGATSEPEA